MTRCSSGLEDGGVALPLLPGQGGGGGHGARLQALLARRCSQRDICLWENSGDIETWLQQYQRSSKVLTAGSLSPVTYNSGLRPLFHCHGLKDLSLADNELGNVPTALSSLAQLVSLDVSKNVLIDLPETIKQCKHLAVIQVFSKSTNIDFNASLQASVNPLQKIPEGCTQLISLTELYLNDCLLEYIPANFGRLSKLKILELRENSLNSLPKSMERLVSITRIDLSQNQFTEVRLAGHYWLQHRDGRLKGHPSFWDKNEVEESTYRQFMLRINQMHFLSGTWNT